MKEKINITELLKKCCVRTWLYCPMFGNCLLSAASTDEDSLYPIKIVSPNDDLVLKFSNDGTLFCVEKRNTYFNNYGNECLLFPSSGYRSWEGVKVENGKLVIPEIVLPNKFYYYGNEERYEEIKDEFKKLGAKNTEYCNFLPGYLYYIDNVGNMNCTKTNIVQIEALLVSQGYKKLELSYHPKDKELVWCWDNNSDFGRDLAFYDAKNNRVFHWETGERNSFSYKNYAPYEGEYPDWAKEALKHLED